MHSASGGRVDYWQCAVVSQLDEGGATRSRQQRSHVADTVGLPESPIGRVAPRRPITAERRRQEDEQATALVGQLHIPHRLRTAARLQRRRTQRDRLGRTSVSPSNRS